MNIHVAILPVLLAIGTAVSTALAQLPSERQRWHFDGLPVETTPPEIVVTEPIDGLVTTKDWINIRGHIIGNYRDTHVRIDGQWAHGKSRDTFWHSRYRLEPGENKIEVTCHDRSGNVYTQIVTVVQDITMAKPPPTALLELPEEALYESELPDGLSPSVIFVGPKLDVDGSLDDERARVHIHVQSGTETKGPFVMVCSDDRFRGSIQLFDGWNELVLTAADAAQNASTNRYILFCDTNVFMQITYPRSYQVMNAPATEVWGVAAAEFLHAHITINGSATHVFPRRDHVAFATRKPIPLNPGITMIRLRAVLDEKTYYLQ